MVETLSCFEVAQTAHERQVELLAEANARAVGVVGGEEEVIEIYTEALKGFGVLEYITKAVCEVVDGPALNCPRLQGRECAKFRPTLQPGDIHG